MEKLNIKHYRGDTFERKITIEQEDSEDIYTPDDTDVIKFQIRESSDLDADMLVEKTISPATMILRLESEDTQSIEAGTYYYDMQLTYTTEEGVTNTVTFLKGKFVLEGDITR